MSKIELSQQIRHLPLVDSDHRLASCVRSIAIELRRKGISWRPHLWVADDWFCPDGVPGFALPFYLFHPQLVQLQKKQMGFVEGVNQRELLRLLRHETGHAIDNAFRLRKYQDRQKRFGSSKTLYPESYWPQKHRRGFINYLGDGYGQSHPDEDFAESFAAWLDPQFTGDSLSGAAKEKYIMIESLMSQYVVGKKPVLQNRRRVDVWSNDKRTLRSFYKSEQKRKKLDQLNSLDPLFYRHIARHQSRLQSGKDVTMVDKYLALHREKLTTELSTATGEYKYVAKRVINITIRRARESQWQASEGTLQQSSRRLLTENLRVLKQAQLLNYYL